MPKAYSYGSRTLLVKAAGGSKCLRPKDYVGVQIYKGCPRKKKKNCQTIHEWDGNTTSFFIRLSRSFQRFWSCRCTGILSLLVCYFSFCPIVFAGVQVSFSVLLWLPHFPWNPQSCPFLFVFYPHPISNNHKPSFIVRPFAIIHHLFAPSGSRFWRGTKALLTCLSHVRAATRWYLCKL